MPSSEQNGRAGAGHGVLLAAVKRFFDEDDWDYDEADDALRLTFGGKSGQWRCLAQVREDAGQVLFYSYAPVEVPEERLPALLELVAWANFGLYVGSFDLNPRNGALQFRTSIDVEGDEEHLTPRMLKHLVYQNVLTMDKYLPAIRAALDGTPPGQAVQAVERR